MCHWPLASASQVPAIQAAFGKTHGLWVLIENDNGVMPLPGRRRKPVRRNAGQPLFERQVVNDRDR
ncbi:hypothetical protein, partial [Bremerella sp.]|uniref:hypothetical protein n=1 Tax=Bremerella sp. TaxID=2795602 RepID=UPI00391AC0BD